MMVLIHSQIEWQARYRTGVQFQSDPMYIFKCGRKPGKRRFQFQIKIW